MSFTEKQLKQIRKIKKAFGKLNQLHNEQDVDFLLQVGSVEENARGETVAFNQLFITSCCGTDSIMLAEEQLIFTPETEQQRIFELAKECLEWEEEKKQGKDANSP